MIELDLNIIERILNENGIDLGNELFAVIPQTHPDIILVQGETQSQLLSVRTYLRYKNLNELGL
jgi:hypothetical protein